MKNKKVLILGATGFIGLNLLIYFAKIKNYKVYACYNKRNKIKIKNVIWLKADLRKYKEVEKIFTSYDYVFQAAATTSGSKDIVNEPYLHVTDNAIMNSLILKACYKFKVKHFIFFSCTVMYHSSNKPLSERQFNPSKSINSKYFGVGNTKLYIEKMCEFYSSISDIKFTIIRHSNIYGPFDKFDLEKSHFFGATITKVLTAKTKLTIWGLGKEKRDFLYIDDLINFIKIVMIKQKNKFKIYNCSYGKSYSIKNITSKIIKISNKKISIFHDKNAPNINTNISISSKLAREELNWKPKISIDKGILKTIKWWRENIKI